MMVMAIAFVLTCLSYPFYHHHLLQSHRNIAQAYLLKIAQALEEYHSLKGTYKSAQLMQLHLKSQDHFYWYSLANLSDHDYLLTATPLNTQDADTCGALWLNALGDHGAKTISCWNDFN